MVELLIGTALTAMLMVGVMHSMRALSATHAGPDRRLAHDNTLDAALQALAWDVANARLVRVADGPEGTALTLVGLGAQSPAVAGGASRRARAADARMSPAVVTYRLVSAGRRVLLVRRQRELPETDSVGPAQLVLAGVSGFQVRPGRAPRRRADSPAAPNQAPADLALASAAGLPPAPAPHTLIVRLAVEGHPPREVRLATGAGS